MEQKIESKTCNKTYSNWGKDHKNRRRCRACGQRVTLYIFERDGRKYCMCPKCHAEGPFLERIRVKFIIKKVNNNI